MNLKKTLKSLPHKPGVYKYFDLNGNLLYVGKAKNLFKRVNSYFRLNEDILLPNNKLSIRITKMIEQADRLEYIIVETETIVNKKDSLTLFEFYNSK